MDLKEKLTQLIVFLYELYEKNELYFNINSHQTDRFRITQRGRGGIGIWGIHGLEMEAARAKHCQNWFQNLLIFVKQLWF